MKYTISLLILAFVFGCCQEQKEDEQETLNNKILIEKKPKVLPNFQYLRQEDSLNAALIISERLIKNKKNIDFDDYRGGFLTNCDCKLDSGILEVRISNNGGWIYKELLIEISDSLKVTHRIADDISNIRTTPQYVRVVLSDLTPSVSEIIYGKILSIHDTILRQVRLLNDTGKADLQIKEKYLGHFRCQVK